MNEQLRKAIEEATRVVDIFELYDKHQVDASQAKLLRVIEVLVRQRNEAYKPHVLQDTDSINWAADDDAELIAALEGK